MPCLTLLSVGASVVTLASLSAYWQQCSVRVCHHKTTDKAKYHGHRSCLLLLLFNWLILNFLLKNFATRVKLKTNAYEMSKKLANCDNELLVIKPASTLWTSQTPRYVNRIASLHFVSGANYVDSTKKYDSGTNTVISMISHWATDTLKQSSCIDTQTTWLRHISNLLIEQFAMHSSHTDSSLSILQHLQMHLEICHLLQC